jgi:TolB protein
LELIRNLQRITFIALVAVVSLTRPLAAQQQVDVDIFGSQAASTIKLAYPFPQLGSEVSRATIDERFNGNLLKDLAFAEIFQFVSLPPGVATVESAQRAGAQALLQISFSVEAGEYIADVRLVDVGSKSLQMGKRYRGTEGSLSAIAHTIANELVLYFNGKPGVFLSQVAFISTRTGTEELWVMDYDGTNQRRITSLGALTLTPGWSPDGERLVYTSFSKGGSDIYISSRRGGGRIKLKSGVNLNVSPAFSPDGKEIVFVGSVAGNPDIYLMNTDGSNIRRLTSQNSIESTPSWSPTGRQIAFTSSRNGTPQIYVMDAEGSNVRRISFEGDWNDDAVFSPNGDFLAYTSRVSGRFQIRLMNVSTGQSKLLAGEGSNEQPSWSPDGRSIVFMSNRSGRYQI